MKKNIKTTCPANSNRHVSVSETCSKCRFFKAIAEFNKDHRIPWNERHGIICQFPRRLLIVDEVETHEALDKIESLTVSRLVKNET